VLGLLICVSVHSAAISDREGAKLVIARALAICPTIQLFWAERVSEKLLSRLQSVYH